MPREHAREHEHSPLPSPPLLLPLRRDSIKDSPLTRITPILSLNMPVAYRRHHLSPGFSKYEFITCKFPRSLTSRQINPACEA